MIIISVYVQAVLNYETPSKRIIAQSVLVGIQSIILYFIMIAISEKQYSVNIVKRCMGLNIFNDESPGLEQDLQDKIEAYNNSN
jgi:hypothetical protein